MRVALTGGTGKLGRHAVRRLRDDGHQVVVIDRAAAPSEAVVHCELTDYGQVADVLHGAEDLVDGYDALVHLAAIPAPGLAPDAATFRNNMLSTYHVFQAARRAGIHRIVYASSETVLGLPFDTPPPYLPVDEEYPTRPESTYSLVKHLEEQMARELCRWDPTLQITALRFSNVMDVADYASFPSFDADPRRRKWNLWSYIDGRDGAQAVARALEAGPMGFETFIVANADSVMSRSSASLAAEVFPDVHITKELGEHESLMSIAKARRILGFEPEHSWRDHAGTAS